jgi:cell division protein ZapA (FtsZ GTPase activity inhibitor)
MTEEQKERLNQIAKELGGKVEYLLCSDLHSQHKKIVIEYEHLRKN